MFRKDTTSRGHQRELARKGRHRSQLRVPTCGGMSTDGPQPTQGAPEKTKGEKKKKGSRSVVFWDWFFVPCFLFLFFGGPLCCRCRPGIGTGLCAGPSPSPSTPEVRDPRHDPTTTTWVITARCRRREKRLAPSAAARGAAKKKKKVT
jgi:hypothetical protein